MEDVSIVTIRRHEGEIKRLTAERDAIQDNPKRVAALTKWIFMEKAQLGEQRKAYSARIADKASNPYQWVQPAKPPAESSHTATYIALAALLTAGILIGGYSYFKRVI